MDDTITGSAPANSGADIEPIVLDDEPKDALPVEAEQPTTADNDQDVTQDQPKGDEEPSVPDADQKLKAWAESKGITLDSENAIKLAKIAMDNQAEFQRTRQASKLQESLAPTDVSTDTNGVPEEVLNHPFVQNMVERMDRLEQTTGTIAVRDGVQEFFALNPEAKAFEDKMAQMVIDRPELGSAVNSGVISLSDLYAMAQASPDAIEKAKEEGGREALQKVADKQMAKAVRGSATTSELSTSAPDPFEVAFDSI